MVDREQEQARKVGELLEDATRSHDDLAWIVAGSIIAIAVAVVTGAVEAAVDAFQTLNDKNLAPLVALLVVAPIATTIYSVRRARELEQAKALLTHLATHDALTGFHNRRFLGEAFDNIIRDTRKYNGRAAVVFVDLDDFGKVNDAHGHEFGDVALVAVSDRLREALRNSDVVVRYGGDEFVVICPEVTNAASAEAVAKRMLSAVQRPIECDGQTFTVSASIGVAVTEERCLEPGDVLRDADIAMYRAKAAGGNSVVMFDRSVQERMTPAVAERRLREALDQGQFQVWYQPIVSIWTKRLVGAEAMLRWEDPERGPVRPIEFIPALEETGLIVPVGEWMARQVLRQSREWQDRYPHRPPLNLKLNISPRQLIDPGFVHMLQDAIRDTEADPDRLALEFAESALAADPDIAWQNLRSAKGLGFSLALDDFGTGYSSLNYLRSFTLDLLKIDQSFVEAVGSSKDDTTIVEHIIGMARSLGIVTLAYGVSTERQLELLRSMNCDLGQGPYFSQPQPPEVIDQLMGRDTKSTSWRPTRKAGADDHAEATETTAIHLDRSVVIDATAPPIVDATPADDLAEDTTTS